MVSAAPSGMSFELFVARRYLRAKRKSAFISIVTVIAVAGVAVGVAALIVAMAINNGVQKDLREHLLSANADVQLLEKEPGSGIADWQQLIEKLSNAEHVVAAAPALYGRMMVSTPIRAEGCILKGVNADSEREVGGLLDTLIEGSVDEMVDGARPGIILGRRLADTIGARLDTVVNVLNPQGEMTPFGRFAITKGFRVVGIFDSGFYEYDSAWAFTTLKAAQQSLSLPDVINTVELRLDDLANAEAAKAEIESLAGSEYAATTVLERNRTVFSALEMEKLVSAIAIGLIMLVAALNVLTSLVMMVMEKNKEIAILKSMGARQEQIRRIFVWLGLLIGSAGTFIGLVIGHIVCWVGDCYKLVPLEQEVYGIAHVPFAPEIIDGLLVALAALAISYLITLYPSTSAARVAPVEVLRYE